MESISRKRKCSHRRSALHKWSLTVPIASNKGIKFADVIDFYKKKKHEELSRLIPLHNAILNMVIKNVPNPIEAQRYRIPKIWKGSIDSEIGKAMHLLSLGKNSRKCCH